MKITDDVVRRCAGQAAHVTGGAYGLAFVSKPGDPARYVDKGTGTVFAGVGAERRAAAFYAGIVAHLDDDWPQLVADVIAETRQRHYADITAGRTAAHKWKFARTGWPASSLLAQQALRGLRPF